MTCCNSQTSTVASVVNLVRSQVYHTERPPLFAARCRDAARRAGSSATDDTYLLKFEFPNVTVTNTAAKFRSLFRINSSKLLALLADRCVFLLDKLASSLFILNISVC